MEQSTSFPTDGEDLQRDSFRPVGEPVRTSPRRVGTTPMGASLVAVGALLLAGQLGRVNVLELLRWSPVVLILLGVEILLGYGLSRGGRVKYDFLSMLVCLMLICAGTLCSLVPSVIRWEQGSSAALTRLSDQLEIEVAQAVGEQNIRSLSVHARDIRQWYEAGAASQSAEELRASGDYRMSIHLELRGDYADPAAFSKAAAKAASAVAASGLQPEYMDIAAGCPDGSSCSLYLDRWGLTQSASELESQVDFTRSETAEDFEEE